MRDRRTFPLLGALLLFFVIFPLAPSFPRLVSLVFLGIVFAGLWTVSSHRRQLVAGATIMAPALVFSLLGPLVELPRGALIAEMLSFCLAVGFLSWTLVKKLAHTTRVTADTLSVSISGYILIAVFWALLYSILVAIDPGAIRGPGFGGPHTGLDDAFYFSLVTMTTLGYGDVLPVTPNARAAAALEALAGQLYIAITVARLVGLHIAQSAANERG